MTSELLAGMQGVLDLATKGTTGLMDEALNLFIVLSILDILKFASIFVVFYIVKRFLDGIISAAGDDVKSKRIATSAKTACMILSIVFFVAHSYAGVVNIAKVLVAPNLFLIEKGYNVVKEIKGNN